MDGHFTIIRSAGGRESFVCCHAISFRVFFETGASGFPRGVGNFTRIGVYRFVKQQFLASYGVDRSKVKIERYGYAIACQKTTKDEVFSSFYHRRIFFTHRDKLERLRDSWWNDWTIVEDNFSSNSM